MFESSQIYPFVVRPGKPRIQTIYQFRATIDTANHTAEGVKEKAIGLILGWIKEKYSASLPATAYAGESFDLPLPGQKLECVALPDEGIWSVLLEQPDAPMGDRPAVPGRVWTTEIALRDLDELEFSIRVNCASLSYSEQPIILTRPRIVVELAKNLGLKKIRAISSDPWIIDNASELHSLYLLIQDKKRFLPIILLSEAAPHEHEVEVRRYLLDESALARRAIGYAYVAVLSKEMAYKWTEAVGKDWTVYNGAVRTYYPGVDLDNDNPFFHPRVLANQILFWKEDGQTGEHAFSKFLINKIAGRNIRDRMDWGKLIFLRDAKARAREIERMHAEERLNDLLARTVETEELSAMIEETQVAHQREMHDAKALVTYWETEAEKYNDDAIDAQNRKREVLEENHALRSRIEYLQYALEEKTGKSSDDEIEIPSSYDKIPDWIRKNFAGRLILHNRALQGLKDAAFMDVKLVCECLLCLARDYRNMKIYGKGKNEFEKVIMELQIEDGLSTSDESAGMHGDEYDVRYPQHSNKKRRMERHLCKGTSRDPRYTMRIYYFWDEETNQVVVGWLPGHLKTRNS